MPNSSIHEVGIPNCLVIGAQRSGTTWLYRNLARHPEVWMSKTKELEFFSRTSNLSDSKFEKYLTDNFSETKNYKISGEATPSYFWTNDRDNKWCVPVTSDANPNVPGSVRRFLGSEIRLVLSLRNPVERALAGYLHHFRMGRLNGSESILDCGTFAGIIDIGFYFRHLSNWLEYFDYEQFFIVLFEDIALEPKDVMIRLFEFLDIGQVATDGKPANRGLKLRCDGEVLTVDPASIGTVTMREGPKARIRLPKFTFAEIDELQRIYSSDVDQLSTLIGRKLDDWARFPQCIRKTV